MNTLIPEAQSFNIAMNILLVHVEQDQLGSRSINGFEQWAGILNFHGRRTQLVLLEVDQAEQVHEGQTVGMVPLAELVVSRQDQEVRIPHDLCEKLIRTSTIKLS